MNYCNCPNCQTNDCPAALDSVKAREALEEIRKMAMDHPCFDADCFERRDIDGLCALGGDVCDWTMIAIHAEDGLK